MTRAHELVMAETLRRRIVKHARRERPRECCGFLVGTSTSVRTIVEATNVATGTRRYRVDPREHIALRRTLRVDPTGSRIVGVYHSHPAGAAEPSDTDIAEAHYPEWVHVIVGLGGRRARLRAFGIASGQSWEIPVRRAVPRGTGRGHGKKR